MIDHFGRFDVTAGLGQEGFAVYCDLLGEDHVWAKICCPERLSELHHPYDDVLPYVAATLAAGSPDRLIWGTDWPHSAYFDASKMPNDGVLMNLLRAFVPDSAVRDKILVENAASLFGFN